MAILQSDFKVSGYMLLFMPDNIKTEFLVTYRQGKLWALIVMSVFLIVIFLFMVLILVFVLMREPFSFQIALIILIMLLVLIFFSLIVRKFVSLLHMARGNIQYAIINHEGVQVQMGLFKLKPVFLPWAPNLEVKHSRGIWIRYVPPNRSRMDKFRESFWDAKGLVAVSLPLTKQKDADILEAIERFNPYA